MLFYTNIIIHIVVAIFDFLIYIIFIISTTITTTSSTSIIIIIIIIIIKVSCYSRDVTQLSEKGFFFGYNNYVWLVIVLQAAGGLVVVIIFSLIIDVAILFCFYSSII